VEEDSPGFVVTMGLGKEHEQRHYGQMRKVSARGPRTIIISRAARSLKKRRAYIGVVRVDREKYSNLCSAEDGKRNAPKRAKLMKWGGRGSPSR